MPKRLSSNQIRKTFLAYFTQLHHTVISSSPLVPASDPTLLFTNAGMVQFKDVFLGLDQRDYTRAATVQRCMRAGGKHNDLENVGYTARHHTFFEMLGNFSFGDYFKREAIEFAWRFFTQVLELPPEKLWVTVFHEDIESERIWLKEIGVDPSRFRKCGEKDNFWQMGETGPCGPCTEIFYDHGPSVAGGPPGSANENGDRYVELWNLVFMQYERDISGALTPLPKPSVDTGMGLERIAAVLQGVHDNYDIDIFQMLLKSLSKIISVDDLNDTSMRVIVDHIRSCSFLIVDSVIPSNEGRGYVLRRIIRRAVRHGYRLGQHQPFFYKLTTALVTQMGEAYPELIKSQVLIEQIIKQEEMQFSNTLSRGLKILDQSINSLEGHEIPGEIIFQLYDTYGFPPDLTADIARERGYTMDYAGFNAAMNRQRELSQQSQQFSVDQTEKIHIGGETKFVGYDTLNVDGRVTTLLQDKKPVSVLNAGQKGAVVLDYTPFYAESGGQVGDTGYLYFDGGSFRVRDTQKQGNVSLHIGEVLTGQLLTKAQVHAEVDASRQEVVLNHTATHLLHEALRRVLGNHVAQKGSLVEVKRLRFDFSHPKPMTLKELQAVERLVNQQIRANVVSEVSVMSPDEAKEKGALALFGERYGKQVRVLRIGDFSTEICGGTHANATGDLGLFKITSESACASGVRRIEAVTGQAAIVYVESKEEQISSLSQRLKTSDKNLIQKLDSLLEGHRKVQNELIKIKSQLSNQQVLGLAEKTTDVKGIKVIAYRMMAGDRDTLRTALDQLKQQLGSAAIVLALVKGSDVQLIAGVTKDCLNYFNASALLNHVASQVGGRGGGRPDMAQGGGSDPQHLGKALQSVAKWVEENISE